jgi:hypothetical protein
VEIAFNRPSSGTPWTIFLWALLPLACGSTSKNDVGISPDEPVEVADASLNDSVPGAADTLDLPVMDTSTDAPGAFTFSAWPGDSTITIASLKDAFSKNMSGLVYESASATAPSILWAIQNDPSKLYRLVSDGTAFVASTGDGWTTGRSLRYVDGVGKPDSEGVTRTEWTSAEVYVVAERDNDIPDVSRQSILRYDLGGSKGVVDATNEWNLTADLPAFTLDHGLEGIAWVPDTYLVQKGFFDENKQTTYDPAVYPNHGTGIFLVGIDDSGMIYGYVLDHTANTFVRLTAFSSGQAHSMDLAFDRDVGTLWSLCDDDCKNRMTLLDIDTDVNSQSRGHFILRATVPPPKVLKDMNNEGISIAPESECSNGRKAVFWSDDGEKGGYSIRQGSITCGLLY